MEWGCFFRRGFDFCFVFIGFFEMKMRYDESDNAFIRVFWALIDKVTDLLGEWVVLELFYFSGSVAGRGFIFRFIFGFDLFLVSLFLGGLFSKTEMSEVFTEILRVDFVFDKDRFL